MKKSLLLLALLIFCTAMVSTASAQMGRGWGSPMGWGGQTIEPQKAQEYYKAWEQHNADTADLRDKIWVKRHEMATLLADRNTKKEDLLKKQGELQQLINQLQSQELAFRWDMYQKDPSLAPDAYGGAFGAGMCLDDDRMGDYDNDYGPGMMGGYGPGMMGGYGPAMMGGYGPGMMGGYGPGMMGGYGPAMMGGYGPGMMGGYGPGMMGGYGPGMMGPPR